MAEGRGNELKNKKEAMEEGKKHKDTTLPVFNDEMCQSWAASIVKREGADCHILEQNM